MPPRRAAAAAAASKTSRTTRASLASSDAESNPQPKPKSARSAYSRAAANRRKAVLSDSDDDQDEAASGGGAEDDDDDNDDDDDDGDDDFDDDSPTQQRRRGKALSSKPPPSRGVAAIASKARNTTSRKASDKLRESDESEDDDADDRKTRPDRPAGVEGEDEEDDDEEEEEEDEGDATVIERTRQDDTDAGAAMLQKGPARLQAQRQSRSPEPLVANGAAAIVATTASASQAGPRIPPELLNSRASSHAPSGSVAATPRSANVQRTPQVGSRSVAATPMSQSSLHTPMSSAPAAPPKVRLVIHKMVLKDFKSYAGIQNIGPFHKSFSAVVGPNGSGKSNVIDALLFVFGWRANKMRQGKLSELIHHSAGKESIPSCSVEVWFREIVDLPGPDAFQVVPGSKLVVARTAFRNNSSQYTINARKSTFTEVTTMLKGRGIDLDHKRFLILQGEVESIAQMPPKARNEHEEGLLEYLEDIIGTSDYKEPIEDAAKRVDEANEQRGERLSRLKIVQREKDSLEAKKREAEELLRDQNELTQRQSALWQVYMLECRVQMDVAQKAIEALRARREKEEAKNAGSRAEVETLQAEYEELCRAFDAIAKDTDKVVKELARYEREEVQIQEKRKHLEQKRKKVAKSLSDDKHASSEAQATLESASDEVEKCRRELAKLEANLVKEEAELEKVRDGLKGKTEGLSAAIEEKQRQLQPWEAKISEKQNARDIAHEERSLLQRRAGQKQDEAEQAKAALRELEDEDQAKHAELAKLKTEKSDLSRKVAKTEQEVKEMQGQEAELRTKASAARAKAEEAKASSSASTSRGNILASLSRQVELGLINGFHGRLGNLGVIDDKFDVAVSTACPGLDNIVVDEVKAAQSCIEHLRRHNLGRANFIVLEKLPRMKLDRIETPEGVPRLFDLITPKEARFAPAFYHLLRDTLVAKDLPSANRIAYGAQRWRVVTLDGQLIDKSGTMSGGGNRVARGAMSSKFAQDELTPQQIARLEKERDMAEAALKSHLGSLNEMQALVEAQRTRMPQIDVTIDKINMELVVGQKRIQEAKRRLEDLEGMSQPDTGDLARIAELDGDLESLDAEIDALTRKTDAIKADIDALQEKILEVGGVKLRSQKSTVDGIKTMLELNGEKITKAEVARAKAEKDIAKFASNTRENTRAVEELASELACIDATMRDKASAVAAVRAKVEEAQAVLEQKQDSRDEIKEQLDGHSDAMNAFRAIEVEIKQQLEDNERSLVDNEKRLRHWEEKHAQLQLHHIDEDDDADESRDGNAGDESATTEAGERDGASVIKRDPGRKVSGASHGSKASSGSADAKPEEDSESDDGVELPQYPPEELRAMDKDQIKAEIVIYEEKVQKGMGNLSVLQEYRKREQEFLSRARDLEEMTKLRDEAKKQYDELRKERLEKFMAGFSIISAKLKEMYQTITLGGNAELELVDSLDPFSEGILFSVMPPKKSWKNISNLSGGEKTLSSLALVFALHVFKPTPLYVMDEIDAALDFRNVSIVANLIKDRTKNAQFVIISLRNNMFELASRLVGIYKTNGQTKSLAVHNKDLHAAPLITAPSPRPSLSSGVGGSVAPTPRMRHGTPGTLGSSGAVGGGSVAATPARIQFRAPLGTAPPGSAIPSSAVSRKTIDALHRRTSGASTMVPPTPLAIRNRQLGGL